MVKWNTTIPEKHNPYCLITYQLNARTRDVRIGWVDADYPVAMSKIIAWMPMPEHITRNPDGWFSEFRGVDNPVKPGWYLVCYERNSNPKEAWYNTQKGTFPSDPKYGDVIAWRPFPAPYKTKAPATDATATSAET